MNGYLSAQKIADKWKILVRQVLIFCKDGRIAVAERVSRIWLIPETAEEPAKAGHSKDKQSHETV